MKDLHDPCCFYRDNIRLTLLWKYHCGIYPLLYLCLIVEKYQLCADDSLSVQPAPVKVNASEFCFLLDSNSKAAELSLCERQSCRNAIKPSILGADGTRLDSDIVRDLNGLMPPGDPTTGSRQMSDGLDYLLLYSCHLRLLLLTVHASRPSQPTTFHRHLRSTPAVCVRPSLP